MLFRSHWNAGNATYNGCDVKFKFTITADPTANYWFTATKNQNYIYVDPDPKTPVSTTGDAYGWNGVEHGFYQYDRGNWRQKAGDAELVHEAGHLLGLLDDYNLNTGKVFPGHAGHLMGAGGKIAQDEIDRILKDQKCGCK